LSEKRKSKKQPLPQPAGGPMDVRLLEQIVKLMAANELSVVDVRDGQKRIMMRRGPEPAPAMTMMPQYAAPMAAGSNTSSAANSASAGAPPAAPDEDANLQRIKSPMVGTFYAAPAKGAKPFVTVGSRVDEETDVCIVEAMKVFNNIKPESGIKGTIAKILVQDGQPVEFGQTLFLVKAE
jgi:acetyl-CoA carboxylase biotin carboxyl carrier protein